MAIGSPISWAHAAAAAAARSASGRRPAASWQRVSSSSATARQPPGISRSSSPPTSATSRSAACSARPASDRAPASAQAAWPESMPSSRSLAISTLCSAVARATWTSPAAIAVNVRLKRFQATPCRFSTIRAASTAPSNTSADSAMRPCIHSAVPSIG